MRVLRVYFALALSDVRQQMQHTASFWMGTVGNFLATVIDALGIAVLYASFGTLRGWTLAEIAVLYGIVNTAFALAEGVGRGFDQFAGMVKNGDFDRLLLRPRSAALQVLSSRLELTRLGRLAQALGVLALGIAGLPQGLTAGQAALIAVCIVSGALLFCGLLMMQAAACFWTVESLEVFNVLTYGGITMAAYPLDVYRDWLRRLFLVVVPIGCIGYLPSAIFLGKALPYPPATAYLAPLAGAAFLMLGLGAWALGVRHYRSTGA